jgi:hypothetical protein
LTAAGTFRAFLGMVNQKHGDSIASLQFTQIGQQGCDFATGVLVDAMQPHERIEEKQAWWQFGDGLFKSSAHGFDIEPHRGFGDDQNIEFGELDAGGGADSLEPLPYGIQRIFGGIKKDAPRAGDRKAPQTRSAGGHRNGEIQVWGANTDPGPIRRGYRIDKSLARRSCWNEGGGGAGVAVAGLSHCGDFQAKGAANRGKPLSAAAVDCAAAPASAASLERHRSAFLDPGKPMVQRLASSVADCETGNRSGLATSGLEGVLDVAILS